MSREVCHRLESPDDNGLTAARRLRDYLRAAENARSDDPSALEDWESQELSDFVLALARRLQEQRPVEARPQPRFIEQTQR